MHQLPLAVGFAQPLDFDHFVAGANAAAVMAARALAAGERGAPLLLLGAPGCGKSHLLQAIARAAQRGGRSALYLPLSAYAEDDPQTLHAAAGALYCVDELDVVMERPEWALTLVRLLDRLQRDGGALAARRLPARLLPDLRTRLSACARFALQPLADDDLKRSLQRRATDRGLELPDEVADYLIRRLPRGLPPLLAALDRLDAASLSARRRLTIPFVQQTLAPSSGRSAPG